MRQGHRGENKGDKGNRAAVHTVVSFVAFASLSLCASPARAEIVFFSTGRTMSIKEHRAEDDKLVLTLRAGGEIVCEPSVIDRIVPDEVPWPEPEAEKPAAVVAAAPTQPVKYGEIIDRVSAQHGVDAKLVRAVIQVESAYHERARSPKGAKIGRASCRERV